jgi:hypothetical protein
MLIKYSSKVYKIQLEQTGNDENYLVFNAYCHPIEKILIKAVAFA